MDSRGAATPKAWEETFIDDFIAKRGLKLSTNEYIGALNEANVFKYVLQLEEVDDSSWVDGSIFVYDHDKQKWFPRSQKVKFFVLPEEFNEITKKIEVYERTNELIKSGSLSNVVTPIFTTYCSRLNHMLVCYPTFDESFAEWMHNGGGGAASLPDMMTTMIRDLLDMLPHHDIMRLEESLVRVKPRKVKTPDVFKVLLLPYEGAISHEAGRRTSFATFLRNNMSRWLDLDVEDFLGMLEDQSYTLEDVKGHPILQDGDSIGRLILDCFREDLSPDQLIVLDATVNVNRFDNGAWDQRLKGDAVLLKMSTHTSRKSQAYDLLWFARKTVAHMNENMAKHHHKNLVRTYPGITIKKLYVGFISDLYRLSLNPNYLTKVT